jgi:hypothetical protein
MKKEPEIVNPIKVIVGGLELLVTIVPLLILVTALSFVGMVTFAVLWWVK